MGRVGKMTKAKFKVGDKVKVTGSPDDYTMDYDGCIGTVEKVGLFDCTVRFDGTGSRRYIWNNKMEVVTNE
jgi:hypothetical protein